MKIVGADPFDRKGAALLNSLFKVGFRKSELVFASEIPDWDDGNYLCFGSPALQEYCGPLKMAEVSGEILHCITAPDVMIMPNYAPGFLYHNPNMKGLWMDNLQNAFIWYSLEEKGVIV